MKSEALDISIEDFGDHIHVALEGIFYEEYADGFLDKLDILVSDGHKNYVLILDNVVFRGDKIALLFLDLLNKLAGKGGKLVLVFNSEANFKYFARYRNLFEIYPSIKDYETSGFINSLKRTGIFYSRKTGIRLSPVVAIVLVILVTGWILTLFRILNSQAVEISRQEKLIQNMRVLESNLSREIGNLRQKIGPLKDLGIIADSLDKADYQYISDWIEYLEILEGKKKTAEKP